MRNQTRKLRAAQGMCVDCGNKPRQKTNQRCSGCQEKDRDRQRAWAKRKRDSGLCGRCGQERENDSLKYCQRCRNYKLEHYQRNAEKIKAQRREQYKGRKEYHRQYAQTRRSLLREKVFAAYGGPVCSCCKEAESTFLTVDHINEDGPDHRKKHGLNSSTAFYNWLIANDFPGGFQVLCRNCNWGKHMNGGVCPHQTK